MVGIKGIKPLNGLKKLRKYFRFEVKFSGLLKQEYKVARKSKYLFTSQLGQRFHSGSWNVFTPYIVLSVISKNKK